MRPINFYWRKIAAVTLFYNHNSWIILRNTETFLDTTMTAEVTEDQVRKEMLHLDGSKAIPPEDILVDILKLTADVHFSTITNIINLSQRKHCFPKDVKSAEVMTIFRSTTSWKTNWQALGKSTTLSIVWKFDWELEKHRCICCGNIHALPKDLWHIEPIFVDCQVRGLEISKRRPYLYKKLFKQTVPKGLSKVVSVVGTRYFQECYKTQF